ncbi:MAG: DNA cytosine methyltransferase [Boseongicola sp. SB0677_bin_26]|nr:DNA cytosine methyltransferase [Boseongicola sp. SB0665_bin_10]MYG26738.1 DNA cytosine methyltransferase [Boseongicola sp. SB0677_bin_26]
MSPKCIDLFAGCGGLSLGLGAAGFEVVLGVEGNADAFATYERNLLGQRRSKHGWPRWIERRAWRAEDILARHFKEISSLSGKIDLLAGGPPCQGFTTNGLRHPDDPRSKLVDVYLQYVETLSPHLALLENVRGFVSMKHNVAGTYADYVRNEFSRLGYQCWDAIIHCSEWGIPQRRPRFILVAAPIGSLPGIDPMERLRVQRRSFLENRGLGPTPTSARDALSDFCTSSCEKQLDVEWGHLGFKTLKRRDDVRLSPYQKLMRRHSSEEVSDMRLARHSLAAIDRMQEILNTCERGTCVRPKDREKLGLRKRSTTPLDPDAPAPTVSTLPDDLVHYSQPRSMSVREHARLQSFPDWFSFCGPYTSGGKRRRYACPRFTQVANAVPPLLAEALGEMLLGLLAVKRLNDLNHRSKRVDVFSKCLSQDREVGKAEICAL